ncbi:MAG: hypothetical protein EXS46_01070 [Candidatus Taylorbacteria bacterium]|nr:hypothetical protein [Candidatus Taylorbacteria bacterium]
MKTMIRFLTVLVSVLGFVVEASQQIKVPDRLPTGTGFPSQDTWISIDVGYDDPNQLDDPLHVSFLYDPKMGTIEQAVYNAAENQIGKYVARPGSEIYDHTVNVGINQFFDVNGYRTERPIGGSKGRRNFCKLIKAGEQWIYPKATASKIVVGYQSYIAAFAGGLSEVQVVLTDNLGNEVYKEVSSNGISDVTCSQYPGGVAYDGPDMLQIPLGFAYPEYYKSHVGYEIPQGFYRLLFGPNKAIWATYSFETGRKIASNESAPEVPIRLQVSVVNLPALRLASLSKKASSTDKGFLIRVTGPVGQVVSLEYADELDSNSWEPLSDLILSNGTSEFTDEISPYSPARFYRARKLQ